MLRMIISLLFAAVVLLASSPASAALEAVAGWTFDDTYQDSVYNYNGASYGASFAADHPNPVSGTNYDYAENKSLYLNGTAYVRVDSDTNLGDHTLAFAGDLTVSMWMKSSSTSADQRVFYFCRNTYPALNYQITMESGKVGMMTRNDPNVDGIGTWHKVQTPGTWNDGQWHHFVFTNDGAETNIYVDGSLDATGPALSPTPWNGDSAPLDFGKQTTGSPSFTGYLDEVQIFDGLADETTANQLYTTSMVPEPASLSLLLCGAASLYLRKRSKR